MDVKTIFDMLAELGGLTKTLGIRVTDRDAMATTMTIGPEHTGAPRIAHGGSVMALLDTALGAAALQHALAQGKGTSTVELKVNFLRPVPEGATLVVQPELEYQGSSLLVARGKAIDQATGKAVALALGTFNLFPVKELARHLEPPVTASGDVVP